MAVGDFDPHNLLAIESDPDLALVVFRVQLLAISAFSLCALGILVLRRIRSGRPLRRSLALLIDSFALGLVLIALFLTTAAFEGPWLRELRWLLLATLGLAPLAFLAGLLQSRLARAALGDLLVELRHEPAPEDLRDALARALRDPSLSRLLAAGARAVGGRRRPRGGAAGRGRSAGGDADRTRRSPGGRAGPRPRATGRAGAAGGRPRRCRDRARAGSPARRAAGAARGAQGLAGADRRGRRHRAAPAGARPPRRRPAAARRAGDVAAARRVPDPRRSRRGREDGGVRARGGEGIARRAARARSRDPSRGARTRARRGAPVARRAIADPGRADAGAERAAPAPGRDTAYFVASEALADVGKYAQASRVAISVRREHGLAVITVADDGVGGADEAAGSGLRGLVDRVEALGGRLHVVSPVGSGTVLAAEIPCVLVDGDPVAAHATRRAPT